MKMFRNLEAIGWIVSNFGRALFAKILAAAGTFLLGLTLARSFGAEQTGVYYFSMSIVMAVVVLSRFGLDFLALRLASKAIARAQWGRVLELRRKSVLVIFLISVTCIVFIEFLMAYLQSKGIGNTETIRVVRIMAPAIFPVAALFLIGQLLRATGSISLSQLVNFAAIPSLSVFLILIGLTLSEGAGVALAGYAYLIASFLVLIVGWKALSRRIAGATEASSEISFSELFKGSMPFLIINSTEYLLAWGVLFLTGFLVDEREIGILAIALRISLLLSLIQAAVGTATAPKFAVFYSEQQFDHLKKLAQHSTRVLIALGFPMLLLVTVGAEFILTIFGEEFVEGTSCLIVLAIGAFVNIATGNVGGILMMTEYAKLARNIGLVGVVLMPTLIILLTPSVGIIGAALAVAITQSMTNLLMLIAVRKKMGFWTI